MSGTLAIAAGGGGDAITAAVLARALGFEPVVMTYSWDRLIVDPLPGPRARGDFEGLRQLAPNVSEVLPSSTLKPPGNSSLPQLAAELPARLLLLDPSAGATGMAGQIRAAADHLDVDELAVIDVGGDAVAEGHEPGLRSPLADFLALASACSTGLPVQLLVTGIPLDAELTEGEVLGRLHQLDAAEVYSLTADDFAAVRPIFAWHPSEANALLAAAARGVRGSVDTRDHAGNVTLTDHSATVYAVDGHTAVKASAADSLTTTTTIDEVEDAVRGFHGASEIDYERRKAATRSPAPPRQLGAGDLAQIDDAAATVARNGASYITVRRLAELLGATDPATMGHLRELLADHRASRYDPPLYLATNAEPPPRR